MDRLKELFYSKEFNMGSLKNFRKFLKEKNVNVSYKDVKEFYEKQDLIQRSKPLKSKSEFNPIITLEPNNILYMDTTFLFDDKIAVITAMDLFSKKLYAYPLKVKKSIGGLDGGKVVRAIDSRNFLESIVETDDYKIIRVDGGAEFQKQFKKVC